MPEVARRYYEQENPFLFDLLCTIGDGEEEAAAEAAEEEVEEEMEVVVVQEEAEEEVEEEMGGAPQPTYPRGQDLIRVAAEEGAESGMPPRAAAAPAR